MGIKTAIILAGGFGTRLQSVVIDVPKPMAPINSIPFLDYQLTYLKHYGIENIILSVGYLNEKIRDYYQHQLHGLNINYVIEETPLGTGGGIRKAMELNTDELVLALNGDSFFDVDLHHFKKLHTLKNAQMSLALRKVENASRYGAIEIDESYRIVSFKEKSNLAHQGFINAGIYLLQHDVFLKHTPANCNFSIEKDFFEKQLATLPIYGFEFSGYFIDIGIPEDYTKAQHDFKEFKYR